MLPLSDFKRNLAALIGFAVVYFAIQWDGDPNANLRALWNLPWFRLGIPFFLGAAAFFVYAGSALQRALLAAVVPVLAHGVWEAWWHAELRYPYSQLMVAVPHASLALLGAVLAGTAYLASRGRGEEMVGPLRMAALACAMLGNFVHLMLAGWSTNVYEEIASSGIFYTLVWAGGPFYVLCIVALANRSLAVLLLTLAAIAALSVFDVAFFNAWSSREWYALLSTPYLGAISLAALAFLAWLGNHLESRKTHPAPEAERDFFPSGK